MSSSAVDNRWIWWLAFAPLVGAVLENLAAVMTQGGVKRLWLITAGIHIFFIEVDAYKLRKAGYDPSKLGFYALVPVYMAKRARLLKQSMTYAIVWCVTFALLVFGPVGYILQKTGLDFGMGFSPTIMTVRAGEFSGYPKKKIGPALDKYLSNPKWTSFVGTDGETYVQVEGGVTYKNKLATLKMQFQMQGSNNFKLHAAGINGQVLNALEEGVLLFAIFGDHK